MEPLPVSRRNRGRVWLAVILPLLGFVLVVMLWRCTPAFRGTGVAWRMATGLQEREVVSPTEVAWPAYPSPKELWNSPTVGFRGALGDWPLTGRHGMFETDGIMLPCAVDSAIVITLQRPDSKAGPQMQDLHPLVVGIAWVERTPTGNLLPVPGTHFIQAWLNAAQADEVLQHGVPKELQAALRAKATSVGWNHDQPGTEVILTVNPDPYFVKK